MAACFARHPVIARTRKAVYALRLIQVLGQGLMTHLLGEAEDLGEVSQKEVIQRLIPLAGLKVLDVGCGRGDTTRELARLGAGATGIEPDPAQATKNRSAAREDRLTFIEGPGQNLPIADRSLDGVFFNQSLHHVPPNFMDAALIEAVRVLKPDDGYLYVLEPMPEGNYDALYRSFHDELHVRARALEAVARITPHFQTMHEYTFSEIARFEDFEAFVARAAGSSFNNITREQVDTPEVRTLFEAGATQQGYEFTIRNRVNLFMGPGK